ncbi:hypothetical protein SY91_02171 [Burkholderia cenocepacia]|uniref:DUF6173 family protein n=1 Tax=Burkholderia cenocepacia TaxID=95486 RepID=UPI0005C530DB|nr:DUF6173 family protein [Burkholderia cenocepacia]QND94761.1 hypothetical protein SY91_02171 [Burkholderia cenocepacia]
MSRSGLMSDPDPIPSGTPSPYEVMVSPGHVALQNLINEIKAFESTLTSTEAVGAMLASFGKSITLQITEIAAAGQFIRFTGVTDEGIPATLVQHYSQASLLLTKLTKPLAPPNPIGFVHN